MGVWTICGTKDSRLMEDEICGGLAVLGAWKKGFCWARRNFNQPEFSLRFELETNLRL